MDMKATVRVALAQIDIAALDAGVNREKILDAIAVAAESDSDIVVFPELANLGYIRERDRSFGAEYWSRSESLDGPTVKAVVRALARREVIVVVGLAERHPTLPAVCYNSAVTIGPAGVIGVHRKVHLAGEEKHHFAPGNAIATLATPVGMLGVGVCYDVYFPELCRLYALQGAHIIVAPFNTGERYDVEGTVRYISAARAIENKLFVACCNRVGRDGEVVFDGGSVVAAPSGEVLLSLGREEVIRAVDISYRDLCEERSFHPVLVDRRPDLYSLIAETTL